MTVLDLRIAYREFKEKVWLQLAWAMPSTLVYWCAIRLMAHATTGKYGKDAATDVSIIDALNRWNDETNA